MDTTLVFRIQTMREHGLRAIKLGWDPFGRQSLAEDEKLIRLARRRFALTLLV